MESSELITIQVKSPSFVGKTFATEHSSISGSGDLVVHIPLSSKVEDLKREIHNRLTGSPTLCGQKIIYAGRLLEDEVPVAAVFQQRDQILPPTVHVVLDPSTVTHFSTIPIPADNDSVPILKAPALTQPMGSSVAPRIVLIDGLPYALYSQTTPFALAEISGREESSSQDSVERAAGAAIDAVDANDNNNNLINNRTTMVWLGVRLILLVYILGSNASFERSLFMHLLALAFFVWKANLFRVNDILLRAYNQRQAGIAHYNTTDPNTSEGAQQSSQRPTNLIIAFFRSLIPS